MDTYILVKKSQVPNYFKTPLYLLNQETGYVLYKPVNKKIDKAQYSSDNYPSLYIQANDRRQATNEVQTELKKILLEKIHHGEINQVKQSLCEIVSETFADPTDPSIESLPETIDIMYEGFSTASQVLRDFHQISYAGGYPLVDHSVNVMALALLYCLDNAFREPDTKRISLCALLHDIGVTQLPRKLTAYPGRLPDRQYHEYQAHPAIGHDIVKQNENIDASIARGILEHHERLDGNGYPRGIANLSFEGRLIGLIDSFDSLTNSAKTHRQKKKPFDALLLIKTEVLHHGCFDREIYKNLCLSLGRKPF